MAVNYYTDTSQDGISAREQELYNLIMAYRASLGLPSIPFSESLSITAARHALDTVENVGDYAGHAWSDRPYDSANPATYPNMWDAPERVGTPYTDNGYEITTGYVGNAIKTVEMTPQTALDNWKGSAAHNAVITNTGTWANIEWKAIGVGLYKGIAHVWFGAAADPLGDPVFEAGAGGGSGATGNTIDAALLPEVHNAGNGATLVRGTSVNLLGDTISNFGADDTARFTSGVTSVSQLSINNGVVTVIGGVPPTALTLQGDFSGGRFFGVGTSDKAGLDLFFAKYLQKAALVEAQAVSTADVNGGPHLSGLTGNGTRSFVVTLDDAATAAHRNALGVYEIRPDGTIVDVRLLFSNAAESEGSSVTVGGVEAGHRLGFFIASGAAIGMGDTLSFVDAAGAIADIGDKNPTLRINGSAATQTVFHSFAAAQNSDGLVHARSGADPDGTGFLVAFEDLAGGGDRDFQDVVFHLDLAEGGGVII